MTATPHPNPRLREHFLRPRNSGSLADATGRATVRNPVCGDLLTLELRERGGAIEDVRFRASGCSAAIAVASILTERLRGETTNAAREFGRERLLGEVGPLPRSKHHAVVLALDALRAALASSHPRAQAPTGGDAPTSRGGPGIPGGGSPSREDPRS